ncbi:MAG: hypothetical protein M5U28_33270 [Sandaracinaceae bacterium]|nr:hypothetical protein [Sandaracinaceae bacterium]
MSERRSAAPAAGARVASGRLRVDAARAVDKLRGYQLPDPTMWVLEVVRAAALAGATRIRVHGDADDVVVAWEGEPIDAEDLARLLDELVDPAPALERRHLRLLATGVNTALGLDPRWVDVTSTDGASGALAVRYTPRLLERGEDGAARGLRELRAQERVPGPLAPPRGVMVHVRRLPLLGALPILIGIGEPAELSVVRRACADVRVPLGIGRAELGRDRSHGDLLRLALREGLDGFLALVDPSVASGEPRLEVAELGVLLARYTLPIEGSRRRARRCRSASSWTRRACPRTPRARRCAWRSRPCATRSRPRPSSSPRWWSASRASSRARARTRGRRASASGSTRRRSRSSRPPWPARTGARGSPGSSAAARTAPRWRGWRRSPRARRPRQAARALELRAPPRGRARARGHGSGVRGSGGVVRRGAVDPSGDPASVLLGDWRAPTTKALLARVRGHRGARERWRREKPRPPAVQDGPGQLLSVPVAAPGKSLKSCVSPEAFRCAEGVTGELVLRDPRSVRASTIVLRLEGRELERLSIDLPIAVLAEVEHPALRPTPDYRGAEHDEVFVAVIEAVRAAAVVACEALALRMELREKKGDRATVRAAWIAEGRADDRAVLVGVVRGGIELAAARGAVAAHALRDGKSPLLEAEVWPLAGGGWRSLREILAEASRPPPRARLRAPRPRPPGARGGPRRPPALAARRERDPGARRAGRAGRLRPRVRRTGAPRPRARARRADARRRGPQGTGGSLRGGGRLGARAAGARGAALGEGALARAPRARARRPARRGGGRARRARSLLAHDPGGGPGALRARRLDARALSRLRRRADRRASAGADRGGLGATRRDGRPRGVLPRHRRARGLARRAARREAREGAGWRPVRVGARRGGPREPRGRGRALPSRAHPVDPPRRHALLRRRRLAPPCGRTRSRRRPTRACSAETSSRPTRRSTAGGAPPRARVALHRHRLGPVEDPASGWAPSIVLAGTGFRSGAVTLATRADAGAEILVSIEGRRFTTREQQGEPPPSGSPSTSERRPPTRTSEG